MKMALPGIMRLPLICALVFIFACILLGIFGTNNYSPQEITELQKVPLILQGDTDFSGSNFFAATVSTLFVLGLIGTYIFTAQLHFKRQWLADLIRSLWIVFLLYQSIFFLRWLIFMLGISCTVWEFKSLYFSIDYIGIFLLFDCFFILSALWIKGLGHIPTLPRYVLAPTMIILLFYIGSDGLTEKSGQVLQSGEIPMRNVRSWKHAVVLSPRDLISKLSNFSLCPKK